MARNYKINQVLAAHRMRALRLECGEPQRAIADVLGIHQSSYNDMEFGRLVIRRRDLVTLALHYGRELDVAFRGCIIPRQTGSTHAA